MRERRVSREEILAGFDALADIYSHVPPLIMWRAWELAVYRHHAMTGPVLDLGCGDGRFFARAFGTTHSVVGLDADPAVLDAARASGLYHEVHHGLAHDLPFADAVFQTVFANCAVEHMDRLDDVLAEVARVLRPDGVFLLSAVTDTFIRWAPLRRLLSACGTGEAAASEAQRTHVEYHTLVNAFPVDEWAARLIRAGLTPNEWSPLMQGPAGWSFLLFDQLWHMPRPGGEFGDEIAAHLLTLPDLTRGTRQVFEGLLTLTTADSAYAGLTLCALK
jgi:SAM-dependent methyltransferase